MLIWKTDWKANDNHARAGSNDLARIVSNYMDIAQRLNEQFGYGIELTSIPILGYNMYPFADVLNTLERNLLEIYVLPVDLYEGSKAAYMPCGPSLCGSSRNRRIIQSGYIPVTWYPMRRAPTHDDVNRWERNGMALDRMSMASSGILLECGVGTCGEPLTRQLYGDFYGLGAPGGIVEGRRVILDCGVGACGMPMDRQIYGDWGDYRNAMAG